ncbi:MAG: branched-chain amino acid ABC transporter permease [Chloroflexota bacterium]|nr:MAG: branched-chain amino acid ABC transporter permease [Chloroflexota bacterium]
MVSLESVPQLLASGLMVGLIYGLVALCFHVIFNTTGIMNFATGEFVVLGGLLFYTFNTQMGLGLGLAFVLMLIITTIAGAAFERIVIFPLQGMPHLVPVIATLGAIFAFRVAFGLIWGKSALFVGSFSGDQPIPLLGAMVLPQAFWILGVTVLVLGAVYVLFRFTMFGRGLQAVALNEEAAKIIGVNMSNVTLYVFILATVLSATAGGLIAPVTTAKYDLGVGFTLKGMAASILGGVSNPVASVAGGILIGLLEALVAGMVSSAYRDAVIFSVIIVMLALRPTGLFGRREIVRV